MNENYYEILGLTKNASDSDIRKSYLNLVKSEHPDMGGNPEKFIKIKEAYETLSDRKKRFSYDMNLNNKGNYKNPNNNFNKNSTNSSFFFDDNNSNQEFNFNGENLFNFMFKDNFFQSYFENVFTDLNISKKINISFKLSCFGGDLPITYKYRVYEPDGSYEELENRIVLSVKESISEEQIIEVKNKGHILDDKRGVLRLSFNIIKSEGMYRKNIDIFQIIHVNFLDILLSRKMQIYDASNKLKVFSLCVGMQNGDKICFKKMGAVKNSKIGDYYLVIKVILPNSLTKEEENILSNLSFPISEKINKEKVFILK